MAEWRLGASWSEEELKDRLEKLRRVGLNFPESGPESQAGTNWRRYYSESIVAREQPGPPTPGGAYETAWTAIENYQFSDPGIVQGHFDAKDEFDGRSMVLELKILGLNYLCGVRVTAVTRRESAGETVRAFRYDTLEGHIEVGSEWFLLTKKHDTGEIFFRISASWRPGTFPNWWTRVGFHVFSHRYQLAWHRLSYVRLREIIGDQARGLVEVPRGDRLIHTGPDIINSDLWILKDASPAERVREITKDEAQAPETEVIDRGEI